MADNDMVEWRPPLPSARPSLPASPGVPPLTPHRPTNADLREVVEELLYTESELAGTQAAYQSLNRSAIRACVASCGQGRRRLYIGVCAWEDHHVGWSTWLRPVPLTIIAACGGWGVARS